VTSQWPGNAVKQKTTFGGLSRSLLMSKVHSRGNRTTECRLAALLREERLSGWRRHQPLLGNPDFTWPTQRVIVFVDGCFWHGHRCGKNVSPKTNAEEWREKIDGNQKRDSYVTRSLRLKGWIVVRIWECELARRPSRCLNRVRKALSSER
jgi:DNA mismatch endonuclease (patch repair protein)